MGEMDGLSLGEDGDVDGVPDGNSEGNSEGNSLKNAKLVFGICEDQL